MFLLLQYDKGMFLSLFPNRTSISPTNFRSFLVLFLHEKEKGERAFKTKVGPGCRQHQKQTQEMKYDQ